MYAEKNPFRGVKLFFIGYFAVLVLILTFVGIMDWMGYKMTDMSIEFALFALLLCSALIALVVWIVRRLQRSWVKIVVGATAGVLIVGLAMAMLSVFSMMMLYNVPMHYTTLTSPSGKDAVVLRLFSRNMEAADARAEIRRAADSGANPEEYALSDLAYEYTAYPRFAGFFYNSKLPSEGTVEIGSASEGRLMYDWPDENTLHMYIENPDAFDSGELTLTLE